MILKVKNYYNTDAIGQYRYLCDGILFNKYEDAKTHLLRKEKNELLQRVQKTQPINN